MHTRIYDLRTNLIENGNETLFISSEHLIINMHFASSIVYYGNVSRYAMPGRIQSRVTDCIPSSIFHIMWHFQCHCHIVFCCFAGLNCERGNQHERQKEREKLQIDKNCLRICFCSLRIFNELQSSQINIILNRYTICIKTH